LDFSSPERSYYSSCGEGSPGSSDGFLDDLVEIKEEAVDCGTVEIDLRDLADDKLVEIEDADKVLTHT
jgi:hypothetical protein